MLMLKSWNRMVAGAIERTEKAGVPRTSLLHAGKPNVIANVVKGIFNHSETILHRLIKPHYCSVFFSFITAILALVKLVL